MMTIPESSYEARMIIVVMKILKPIVFPSSFIFFQSQYSSQERLHQYQPAPEECSSNEGEEEGRKSPLSPLLRPRSRSLRCVGLFNVSVYHLSFINFTDCYFVVVVGFLMIACQNFSNLER